MRVVNSFTEFFKARRLQSLIDRNQCIIDQKTRFKSENKNESQRKQDKLPEGTKGHKLILQCPKSKRLAMSLINVI